MIIFPAIDISGGKVVRLYKGDYNQMTVYNGTPLEIAKSYEADKIQCLWWDRK